MRIPGKVVHGCVLLAALGLADCPDARGADNTPPAVQSITPSLAGPTNADEITFNVIFTEHVTGFNSPEDVVVTATGTLQYTASIVPYSPIQSFVSVSGIAGDGSFHVAVSVSSDVRDLAGNPLDSSIDSAEVYIDNTPPLLSVDPVLTNDTTPPLSGTVAGSTATIQVLVEGYLYNVFGDSDGNWVLADDLLAELSEGPHDIALVCYDAAGNAGHDSTSNELVIDVTPPAISNLSVSPPSVEAGEAITVSFEASEDLVDTPDVTVNGREATPAQHFNSSGLYTFGFVTQESDAGEEVEVGISGQDLAGNAVSQSFPIAVSVLSVPPVPLAVSGVACALLLAGVGNLLCGRRRLSPRD